VPAADICSAAKSILFDDLVGAGEQAWRHFEAECLPVSTVGRDQEVIREYIRKQKEEDKRLEQMNLWR
jgi:hypothetical protein